MVNGEHKKIPELPTWAPTKKSICSALGEGGEILFFKPESYSGGKYTNFGLYEQKLLGFFYLQSFLTMLPSDIFTMLMPFTYELTLAPDAV